MMPTEPTTPKSDGALTAATIPTAPASPAGASIPDVEALGSGKAKLPPYLRGLFRWALPAFIVPQLAFSVTTYFVAIQAEQIDPAAKVQNVALISAISAIAAMIVQPLIGVLSDRTRTRIGSRRPWILVGVLIGAVALITAGVSTTVAALIVAVSVVQFGFGAVYNPLSSLLPDHVPDRFKGRFSTLAGVGGMLAGVLGPVLGSQFAAHIPAGYLTIAGITLVISVLFVVFVRIDADNRGTARARFSFGSFIKAYWVNPVKYPDFFWGFLGRIMLFGSFALLSAYSLYIGQDYVGLSFKEAAALTPLFGAAALPGILIAASIAGPLSDRIGRRKPIVLIAGVLLGLAAIPPIISPTIGGVVTSYVIIGFGFGAFLSVDQALMSQVLPNSSAYAKDLGVLNIATTLPNVISPLIAGLIVTFLGGYFALYVAVAVVALIGAVAVLPIKSVR
jgi:MFS family permease